MTLLDAFVLGAGAAIGAGMVLSRILAAIVRRVHVRNERIRAADEVRQAYLRVAKKLRQAEVLSRVKWDQPWVDRVRAAQIADLVTFGIRVDAATPPPATAP